MRLSSAVTFAAITGLLVGLGYSSSAQAADAPASSSWLSSIQFSGYIDGGITANPDSPSNGVNFGRLYTDRSNMPVLNQLSVTATKPLDPKATGADFGFTLQGMYGTDARYTHFFNEFDRSINSRYQFDVVEADLLAHLPIPVTSGGMDLKLGQFPTPVGYEVINPSGNPFYSHSYIYNFGIPIKHTGVLTITHVSPLLDLYFGIDTGNLTSFGHNGDNNGALAGVGGVGLNLLGGKVTVVALTHIGPENARSAAITNVNGTNRYFNDIVITTKATDKLTFVTDLNYIKDDGNFSTSQNEPDAYGVAQYASYALNDMYTLQARAEIWRDNNGFFASAFPGNFDFTNAGRGFSNTSYNSGKATYEEVTLGVNIKPPVPKMFEGAMLRPEIRYDHAETAKPFNSQTSDHQFTIATDLILPF